MLNYALIGCGRISHNHVVAAKNNHLKIRALCDIEPSAMEQIANCHGLTDIHNYEDYREMLDKEDIHLIAIATESGNHASIARDCMLAGVNLIIEKPISLSLGEIDEIIEIARNNELVLCPCHQNRFNRSVLCIREAVEQGRFGRLMHGTANIRWSRGKSYYEQATWRGTWAQDGGALMNQCIHNIDLLRWMMGDDVEEVFAYTDRLLHPYIEAEDLGLALIKFSNGSYGIIEGTTNVYPDNLEETLYLFGSSGTVKAGGKSVNLIEEWIFADGLDDAEIVKASCLESPPNIYGYGHTPLYTDVVNSIIENREPFIPAEAGRRAVELVLAIYKSAATGCPVSLPLQKASTLDYVNRFS